MKIGIIADTHDDIENVQKAIEIFNSEKVEYVIHAGDYVFPGIVMEFKKLNAKLIGVFGNNDGERLHLLKNFLDIGAKLQGEIGEIDLDGLRFGIYHGTDREVKNKLVNSRRYDVFVCGHTHKIELPPAVSSASAINNNNEKEQQKEQQFEKNDYNNNNTVVSSKKRSTTLVLNPGSAHKKVQSLSGAFMEGGIIIFNTENQQCKLVDLS